MMNMVDDIQVGDIRICTWNSEGVEELDEGFEVEIISSEYCEGLGITLYKAWVFHKDCTLDFNPRFIQKLISRDQYEVCE